MSISEYYKLLGKSFNAYDYKSLYAAFDDDIRYESYNFFYKLHGKHKVIEYFDSLAKSVKNKDAEKIYMHYGYYTKSGNIFKSLKSCVLICKEKNLECTNIMTLKIKKNKIIEIIGLDPVNNKFTRGKKI